MKKGFLSLILHAHLPYVHHPEHDHFFEENWLFEAITESYIPLINTLDRLVKDEVSFRLTLSLSPTLISMLADDLLQSRYQAHLQKQIKLAEKEIIRTKSQPQLQKLARLYRRFFLKTQQTYDAYQGNLILAFKKFYNLGYLELITTTATHAFLPLLSVNDMAVRNQIAVGLETFKLHFGLKPAGFWLPECGYYSGLEKTLAEFGIEYFFVDTHGLLDASTHINNDVYAPIECINGVKVFARDQASSQKVWSAEQGYPGNVNYREYYSDIGFELDLEVISPCVFGDEERINTGIKYHKITGKGLDKQIYNPKKSIQQVEDDAKDFVRHCQQQINALTGSMDRIPIIISPYDAELFGHWWFEGPCWLESVLRLTDQADVNFTTMTCADYLQHQQNHQQAMPVASTWGEGGYCGYWVNEDNAWIYPYLHQIAEDMQQLAIDFNTVSVSKLQLRALNQAARSVLLAQASDWPFILKSGTTTEYAKKRITDSFARFNYLNECIRKNRIDEHYLLGLETMDNIFPDIDFRSYMPDMV